MSDIVQALHSLRPGATWVIRGAEIDWIGPGDRPTDAEIDAEIARLAARADVPQSITRAQARAALIVSGLIGLVQPAIDAIEDPVQRALAQNDWDERLHFERSNPTLLSLAASLGWNDDQLDELFRLGATL